MSWRLLLLYAFDDVPGRLSGAEPGAEIEKISGVGTTQKAFSLLAFHLVGADLGIVGEADLTFELDAAFPAEQTEEPAAVIALIYFEESALEKDTVLQDFRSGGAVAMLNDLDSLSGEAFSEFPCKGCLNKVHIKVGVDV